eukprot:TRINITY_DN5193_c0_g1_i1.p1 TRINITY_DN5193_c0_g1~~TRINITY_DN5193_c0_g1_i1.p1  ORF type:complete len:294 (-),score=43.89 TRINITY_DN5193_c0_g1_i1:27-809(-)
MTQNEEMASQRVRDQVSLILSSGVCSKVISKCTYPAARVQQLLSTYPALKFYLNTFSVMQSRGLGCLVNILLVASVNELGDVLGMWRFLVSICSDLMVLPTLYFEPLEEVTAAMWTLLRKIPKNSPLVEIQKGTMEGILILAKDPRSVQVRTNAIGMLGVLGQQAAFLTLLPDIGNLLLGFLSDTSVLVVVEAVNAILDIFADDALDDLVTKLNMLPQLEQVLPKLSKLVKDTSEDNIMLDRLDEARLNTKRFLEYKKKM